MAAKAKKTKKEKSKREILAAADYGANSLILTEILCIMGLPHIRLYKAVKLPLVLLHMRDN